MTSLQPLDPATVPPTGEIDTRLKTLLVRVGRHDLFVPAALLLLLISGLLSALGNALAQVVPPTFMLLTLLALRHRQGLLGDRQERRFWNDIAWGMGCGLLIYLTLVLALSLSDAPSLPELRKLIRVWVSLSYLCWILAAERRPDQRYRFRPTELEHRLAWPSVSTFVAGLVVYFWILPLWLDRQSVDSGPALDQLFTVFDFYLMARFAYLGRKARGRRWQVIYQVLALSVFVGILANFLPPDWPAATAILRAASFPLIIAAIRLRHLPFPAQSEADFEAQHWQNLPRPSGRSLTFALAFPCLHYLLLVTASPSRPELTQARELVVLVAMVLLGATALVQHRLFEKRARELWRERLRVEKALRQSEKLLRGSLAEQPAAPSIPLSHPMSENEGAQALKAGSGALVAALAIPTLLLTLGRFYQPDPESASFAILLGLASMLALGGWAIFKVESLDRRAGEIWGERRRLEAELSSRESDLRQLLGSRPPDQAPA